MTHPFNNNLLVVAEERAAVADAESFLVGFTEGWSTLSPQARPLALREAVFSLTTLWTDEPISAEIFLRDVACAAELPKVELRRLVQRRADIITNIRELWRRNPVAVHSEVIKWML
jgi:hypothetical protein